MDQRKGREEAAAGVTRAGSNGSDGHEASDRSMKQTSSRLLFSIWEKILLDSCNTFFQIAFALFPYYLDNSLY